MLTSLPDVQWIDDAMLTLGGLLQGLPDDLPGSVLARRSNRCSGFAGAVCVPAASVRTETCSAPTHATEGRAFRSYRFLGSLLPLVQNHPHSLVVQ